MAVAEPVTYTVFDKHPLLGCYYVVCVDTSDVVNFMLDDMGSENWMDDVEKLDQEDAADRRDVAERSSPTRASRSSTCQS